MALCCAMVILFGRTVACLTMRDGVMLIGNLSAEFEVWIIFPRGVTLGFRIETMQFPRSGSGTEEGREALGTLLWWLIIWDERLLESCRKRQIRRPAQKRSKVRSPLAGVTFRRLSTTPLGRPPQPFSSFQRFSISVRQTYPVRLWSMTSKRVLMAVTKGLGRASSVDFEVILEKDDGKRKLT